MDAIRISLVLFAILPLASVAGEDRDDGQVSPFLNVEQSTRRAHALTREAEADFQNERYDLALANYLEAYALLPRPGLHARIGACHKALGDHYSAVERFERFLIEAPHARNRREVEASLQASKAEIDAQILPLASLVGPGDDHGYGSDEIAVPLVAISDTDAPPVPATEKIDPSIPPSREGPATRSPPEWARMEPAPENVTRDRPAVYERWWFWAAVGATAAAAGGAAYAGTRQEPILVLPSGSLGAADWR